MTAPGGLRGLLVLGALAIPPAASGATIRGGETILGVVSATAHIATVPTPLGVPTTTPSISA